MNKRKACEILGVSPDILRDELKRKYRALMNLTHPDTQSNGSFSAYPFDAYEINEAYEYLLSNLDSR